jgi:hypothetical protein
VSAEETRRVVEGFLSDGDSCWLADDVVLRDEATRRQGRAEVVAHLAMSPTPSAPAVLVVEESRAAATWPAIAASYDVSGGEITEIHLYGRRPAIRRTT